MTRTAQTAKAGTIVKVLACALGGALATIAVVAGAVIATCFVFAVATGRLLRLVAHRLPRPARTRSEAPVRAPARAAAVRRTPSMSASS